MQSTLTLIELWVTCWHIRASVIKHYLVVVLAERRRHSAAGKVLERGGKYRQHTAVFVFMSPAGGCLETGTSSCPDDWHTQELMDSVFLLNFSSLPFPLPSLFRFHSLPSLRSIRPLKPAKGMGSAVRFPSVVWSRVPPENEFGVP